MLYRRSVSSKGLPRASEGLGFGGQVPGFWVERPRWVLKSLGLSWLKGFVPGCLQVKALGF